MNMNNNNKWQNGDPSLENNVTQYKRDIFIAAVHAFPIL